MIIIMLGTDEVDASLTIKASPLEHTDVRVISRDGICK